MSPAARVAFGTAVFLLIVALHTVSVGYDSYTPLVFAQLYITFFAFVMMIPTLRRTGLSR